jgi:predicted ABC-type exoprotein transport system permease subunit
MQTYHIRRSFLFPLALVVLLCLVLAAIVIIQEQPPAKLLVVGCALLPLGYLFFECVVRRVEVDSTGLRMIRLGRVRAFAWDEITTVDTVRVRQRAFLTINAGEEFLIIANMYAGFDRLLSSVLERVPVAAISEETQSLAQAPPVKHSDIVILWGLALLMAYLIYAQFPQ